MEVIKVGDKVYSNANFKLSALSKQHLVNCVDRGYVPLLENKDMVERFFDVCGIATTNPKVVRNDGFLKRTITLRWTARKIVRVMMFKHLF